MNDGYDATEIIAQDICITSDMIKYPSVKENIGWCIEKGFLIENKVFEPFDLTFRIEDEDTLLDLWHRLNLHRSFVYTDSYLSSKRHPKEVDNGYRLWEVVDKEMHRIND